MRLEIWCKHEGNGFGRAYWRRHERHCTCRKQGLIRDRRGYLHIDGNLRVSCDRCRAMWLLEDYPGTWGSCRYCYDHLQGAICAVSMSMTASGALAVLRIRTREIGAQAEVWDLWTEEPEMPERQAAVLLPERRYLLESGAGALLPALRR